MQIKNSENINTRLLQDASDKVNSVLGKLPESAIILGSGLGILADQLGDARVIATKDIPGYPPSTVEGHRGRWVLGNLGDKTILAVQGRIHGYEGHPMDVLAHPINILASCDVKNLIVTNAAGAINRFYAPGDFMVIDDHINLTFKNPLFGNNVENLGPRFPDMSAPYDREFSAKIMQIGQELGIKMHKGVYVGVRGPSYETAAEIRMFDRIGADAVGMSTVPEVIAAIHRGMRVAGISCISNMATGISGQPLSHAEVTEVAENVKGNFLLLVTRFLMDS
ncbi:MAG: purine-nucleoside phosphorylase [Deferribacteres bacterium]|nr:purine-nucleoside phosphorylase [Deferribacteres bacterium]